MRVRSTNQVSSVSISTAQASDEGRKVSSTFAGLRRSLPSYPLLMPLLQHYPYLSIHAHYKTNLLSERPRYFLGSGKVLKSKWNYSGSDISEGTAIQETTYSFISPGSGLSWCLTVMASLLTSRFLVLHRKGPKMLTTYSFLSF